MKPSTTLTALVAHCRKLARRQHAPDAELLGRFVEQREAAAFEELLERYAPLVWGVCRRILPGEADCEDAFQAAFLCLFRQAATIDANRPLGALLHTIAVRTAAKARSRIRRLPKPAIIPEQATRGDIADELGNRELFRVVDEEIARLPALLREPFVLCCLEGRTRDEAAAALHCSVAAVKSRLERSRNVLRKGLERRGFGLPAAFLVLGLTGGHVQASLRAKALQCVFGSVPSAVAAIVPAAGVSLASKLALTAMSLMVVGVLDFGAFHVMQTEPTQQAAAQAQDIAPQSSSAEKPQPRADRYGDPLPTGAIRRFGTLRFRHNYGMLYLAFTPDGKQLVAGRADRPSAVFDVATGRKLRTIGNSRGGNHHEFAISPDGKRVVCTNRGTLWDLQTGKLIRQLGEGGKQWSSVAFAPDGKVVAAAIDNQAEIVLVEAETGKKLVDQTWKTTRAGPPQHQLDDLDFSPDGKYLAARFSDSEVWLLDAANCTLVQTFGSSDDRISSFAFQPGTTRLAATGKDGAIRFWDVNTGKEVRRIAAGDNEKTRRILRFLDGGRRCALTAFSRTSNPGAGLTVQEAVLTIVDIKDGKELRRLKLEGIVGPMPIALSPDGRTAATAKFFGESSVRIWDLESGAERLADAGHRAPADLSLSADGCTLISRGGEGRVIHWDLRTGNGQIRPADATQRSRPIVSSVVDAPWRGPRQVSVSFVRFSANSQEWSLRSPRWQLVLHDKTSEMEVRSRDGSKVLRKVKWPFKDMFSEILSPDGAHLAIQFLDDKNNSALLWDPERDNEPHKLEGLPATPPLGYHSQKLLFTHDSKRLIFACGTHNDSPPNVLWIWDADTAKIIRKLPVKFAPDHLVLSSDDRYLLSAGGWEDPSVHVWDIETGWEMAKLTDPLLPPMEAGKHETNRYVASLHLSADERFLAVITNRGNTSGISVWDTAAWKPVRAFPWMKVENRPHSLVFSRDGRSLFVSNSDSTALEWDVSGRSANRWRQPTGEAPNQDRFNALWRKLAETPDLAYSAVWELLDHPHESVLFLIGKLAPVQPVEEQRVRQLLTHLDSESFAEREQASRQLLALGERTLPLLRQALEKGPSLEAKKRIEGLTESLRGVPAPEQLRLLRALAVLEWSNRPEATEHLRKLAVGAPSALLTRAAKAALQRR